MSTDLADPILNAEIWNVIQCAGLISPGVCKLSGFKRLFGWEVKKGKGTKGSTVTLNEYPPAEGSVVFTFWLKEHFTQWRVFRDLWHYDPTKKPVAAVDIYHPVLSDLGINSVVCKSIGNVEHKGKGLYEVSIDLIEYNPPPKKAAVSTPKEVRTFERHDEQPMEKTNESLRDQLLKLAKEP